MTTPTTELLLLLTEKHLRRYGAMIHRAQEMKARLGHCDGYRIDELIGYHALWSEVVTAGYDWARLRPEVRAEVYDAIEDEA